MKNFCIITNIHKDNNNELANHVKGLLEVQNCFCQMLDSVDNATKEYKVIDINEVDERVECVIAVGGDGTLLRVSNNLKALDVVFVGINLGRLGFLAEISTEDIEHSVKRLVEDDFNVESRMMLSARLIRDGKELINANVLNDIVLHRGAEISISNYDVYVNDNFLGTYNADGLIIATPTGSTAYNMSAGGPFARPDSHVIILTPICSHALGSRSIIFSKNDHIEVRIAEDRKNDKQSRGLSLDGGKRYEMQSGDIVKIEMADETTKILKFGDESFLQTIREKIK